MKSIQAKLNNLYNERELLVKQLQEYENVMRNTNNRLIAVSGAIQTLEELIAEFNEKLNNPKEESANNEKVNDDNENKTKQSSNETK